VVLHVLNPLERLQVVQKQKFTRIMTTMEEQLRPTILVVDDDERIRSFVKTTLADADYAVLEARGGLDGIATAHRYDGEIALAVVEIKMPGMGGLDLANHIGVERPQTEVLYMSESTDSIAAQSIAMKKPEAVLPKPFTAVELLSRVRHFLRAA
jgi:two-component system, cell cycle sensor histidine kinase and response regulator CckA